MVAPADARRAMFSSCSWWSGVSRTISTSVLRSFSITSAARDIRLEVTPLAISDMVRMEQGAIIIPSARNEPLAQDAEMSSNLWLTSASF